MFKNPNSDSKKKESTHNLINNDNSLVPLIEEGDEDEDKDIQRDNNDGNFNEDEDNSGSSLEEDKSEEYLIQSNLNNGNDQTNDKGN